MEATNYPFGTDIGFMHTGSLLMQEYSIQATPDRTEIMVPLPNEVVCHHMANLRGTPEYSRYVGDASVTLSPADRQTIVTVVDDGSTITLIEGDWEDRMQRLANLIANQCEVQVGIAHRKPDFDSL